ncbi:Glycosyltransferases involved in cell wall biogenesis [Luteimonas sp. J16]|uniref:glycosyltransferase family 2 protein n=2 Tax=unclassified Luteimonas TaxID=2629088 RepID=UPI00047D684A|nr:glycosyltransferase family 2 protein [Luteimonas sp. J16]TWG88000.1 Glycosyltransferases involved in cell wall biogenesis [Luteimonas sp. J16]
MDRVSVVMPAYNATATLEASMRSALAQTHAEVELLVVDDRSTDGTWDMIQRLAAGDARVVPIRQPRNAGVAAARNAGIEAATGRYIAFLDSDDRWYPDKLAIQLQAMRGEGAAVGYAAYERVDESGRVLSRVRPPARADYARMLKGNCIGNLTGIYDRAIGEPRFTRMGHEDYVFWLQVVRMAGQAVCASPDRVLASYLVRPGSLSANKLRAARWQWRIYRESERLGVVRSGWYFAHYAAQALHKRF